MDPSSFDFLAIAHVVDPFGRCADHSPLRIGQPVIGSIRQRLPIPMAVSLGAGTLVSTAITRYLIPGALLLADDIGKALARFRRWHMRPFRSAYGESAETTVGSDPLRRWSRVRRASPDASSSLPGGDTLHPRLREWASAIQGHGSTRFSRAKT